MANVGDLIDQSYLSSWRSNAQGVTVNYRTGGDLINGYWYICAPSFMISSSLVGGFFNCKANIYASYYNYNTGTWSSEELKLSNTTTMGQSIGTYVVYWGHNTDPAKNSTISFQSSTESKYYLWRIRQDCSSQGAKEFKYWGGPIGVATSTWYNNNIKNNLLQSCGISESYGWSDGTNRSGPYFWVQNNWTQDDNGALNYFLGGNRSADRGTKITVNTADWLCYRG